MTLWLTPEELEQLTGYKIRKHQKLALGKMNVPFRSRAADGYPLVDRVQFESHTVLTPPRRRREARLELVR
jgi:hypothetical protein